MAPNTEEVANAEVDGLSDAASEGVESLLWVPKATLESVMSAIEKKETVSKESVEILIEAGDLADDAVMVPVDMSDIAEMEDVENMIETLGANKVAEVFIQGRKKFLENMEALPEEERTKFTQELSGKEYKEMMEEEMAALAAMGEGREGAEEEIGEPDEVIEPSQEEPAAKKQKTA